jgi:hypothetical protein
VGGRMGPGRFIFWHALQCTTPGWLWKPYWLRKR